MIIHASFSIKIWWNSFCLLFTLHYTSWFLCNLTCVNTADLGLVTMLANWLLSLWPIHQSGNCLFRYSITVCLLKCRGASLCSKCKCSRSLCLFISSWISVHNFVTTEIETHVHVTPVMGKDLGNKVLKCWHKVTGHAILQLTPVFKNTF